MLKLTTKKIYELRDALRGEGFRADLYGPDYQLFPPVAWARDKYGHEYYLVIWDAPKFTGPVSESEDTDYVSLLLQGE